MKLTTSAFSFAHDLVDEGLDVVLDRLQAAHVSGITLAAAYHHARDVFPHNPRHKLVYLDGGTVYFHPDPARYVGPLQPVVASVAKGSDPLGMLVEATRTRGMQVNAWVVFLHNSRLAAAVPDCSPLTAFGDRLLNTLCPAHPTVRAYAAALAGDVARFGVDALYLEALSYMPFDHGGHHERSFVRLSPNVRFLLGLCFCSHCLAVAATASIDAERVRQRVLAIVGAVFESASAETYEAEVEQERLRAECDGELGRFLDLRQQVVTSLVAEVTEAAQRESEATRVVFLDLSGGTLGYATGRPSSDTTAVSIAWRDGIDPAAVARTADGLGMLAYFSDPERFEREVDAYQRRVPDGKLHVILRPMSPDSGSAADLAAKIAVLRRKKVEHIGFYHYGFIRLEALDWIRAAIAE